MIQGQSQADDNQIEIFLSNYNNEVCDYIKKLRGLLPRLLPDIKEELDLPAKMIAYTYGAGYTDLVCVLIPSKKGLKLGFNKGAEVTDPEGWLKGKGKISRYVEIVSEGFAN